MKYKSMKVKVLLLFLFLMLFPFFLYVGEAKAEENGKNSTSLQLYAQSAILMDAGSGRILYEKNSEEIRPMASTTKIMTCILALEYGNLEDFVEVSSYAASMPKVKLNMRAGERYCLKDLLYSLMLESHNDSAVAIAEHIGGSVEGFAAMMNQKAKDIGCFDTFFITPNGLDATATTPDGETKIHSTTAADLAKIMSYCIMDSPAKEEFLNITRTPSYQFEGYREKEGKIENSGRSFSCYNHNAFLSMMEGALSGKTGFTGNAGYCYVGSLKRDDRIFVVALLGCGWPNNRGYKWSDTKKLMAYGLENFTYHSLNEVKVDEESLAPIPVAGGQTDKIGESIAVPVTVVTKEAGIEGVLLKEDESFEKREEIAKELEAPVEKGTEVGKITYLVDGEVYGIDYVITADHVKKIDFTWCFLQVIKHYSIF